MPRVPAPVIRLATWSPHGWFAGLLLAALLIACLPAAVATTLPVQAMAVEAIDASVQATQSAIAPELAVQSQRDDDVLPCADTTAESESEPAAMSRSRLCTPPALPRVIVGRPQRQRVAVAHRLPPGHAPPAAS